MKYFYFNVFALLLLMSITQNALSYDFQIEKMSVDFKGVCHNDNIVIAYGNGGIILYSTDKGNSWKQKKIIDDTLTIHKMYCFDNIFYAVCGNVSYDFTGLLNEYKNLDYFIKSTDNGATWSKTKLDSLTNYYGITYDKNKLYLLTSNKNCRIEVFDYNFSNVKKIYIDTNYNPQSITYFNNKILIPAVLKSDTTASIKTILSYDISNNYNSSTFDLQKYGNISELKANDTLLYAVFNEDTLYKTTNITTWDYITAFDNDRYYFDVYNNNLFATCVGVNSSYYNIRTLYGNGNWHTFWLDFYKLQNKEFTQINNNTLKRYTLSNLYNLMPKLEFDFIDNNTLVAVGEQKTIYLSTNAGVDWDLKCNLNSFNDGNSVQIVHWINSNLGYFVNNDNQIFKTTDAGVIWLPQQFTNDSICYFTHYTLEYFDSTGFGYLVNLEATSAVINIMTTYDYGETFKLGFDDQYQTSGQCTYSKLLKKDTLYLLTYTLFRTMPDNCYTIFVYFNEKLKVVNYYKSEDSVKILNINKLDNDVLFGVFQDCHYPYCQYKGIDTFKLYLKHSNDFGLTWILDTTLYNYGCKIGYPEFISYSSDGKNFFYRTKNTSQLQMIYNINMANITMNKIWESSTSMKNNRILSFYQNNIISINDTLENDNLIQDTYTCNNYTSSSPTWIKNEIIKNEAGTTRWISFDWTNDTLIYGASNFVYYAVGGSYNSYYTSNNLFKLIPQTTTSVSENNTMQSDDGFACSQLYPNPATSEVAVHIQYENYINFESEKIKVCNYIGETVSDKNCIIVNKLNSNTQEIIWKIPQNIINGVYFININFGDLIKSIPVIVNK